MECCTLCRADLKAPAPGVSFIFAIKGLPFTFPFKAVNSTCSDLTEHPGSRESKGRNRISQPWLGLWFLGEHPAAQDVTLLLSPHHRPQVTAHQDHWQQHIPLPSLSAPCLQLPPKGTWEFQELLPWSSLEHHRAQDALFAVQVVVAVALGDTQPCHVCCPGTKQPGGRGGKEEKKGNKSITLQQE